MSAREEIVGKLKRLTQSHSKTLLQAPQTLTPGPSPVPGEGRVKGELPDNDRDYMIQTLDAVETAHADRNALIALFTRNLVEAGGEVQLFSSETGLHSWLLEFVKTNRVSSGIVSSEEYIHNLRIAGTLQADRSLRVEEMQSEQDLDYRAYAEQAQLGIGLAHAGIAESGAIIIAATPRESRSLSLLIETHIAILDAKNLWKSLHQVAPMIDDLLLKNDVAAVTIVAGPSKTADIEKVLITGVHGPKRFIVCIIIRE
jgi:L-lactate dehydrogenase complex protein LldG